MLLPHRETYVHHVQQQVCIPRYVERRAERSHQVMRQLSHETHGDEEQHDMTTHASLTSEPGERNEQPVLDEHLAGLGNGPENGGLSGVRVAHQGGTEHVPARGPLHVAASLHVGKPLLEDLDAVVDEPAVSLQLGFTRSAHANHTAA